MIPDYFALYQKSTTIYLLFLSKSYIFKYNFSKLEELIGINDQTWKKYYSEEGSWD